MNATLPPCLAAALAPFAPTQSVVHQIVRDDEASRIAQDLAYEAAKQSGALDRANERRALDIQIRHNPAMWGLA